MPVSDSLYQGYPNDLAIQYWADSTADALIAKVGAGPKRVSPISLGGGLSIVGGVLTMGSGGPYVLKAGDTMTGNLTIQASGSDGTVKLVSGSGSTYPGYIEFRSSDLTRRGYIGWNSGSSQLEMRAENSWSWLLTGQLQCANNVVVGTSVATQAGTYGYGGTWTTSGWSRAIFLNGGHVLMWGKGSDSYSWGIGRSGNNLYIGKGTTDDNSGAISAYPLYFTGADNNANFGGSVISSGYLLATTYVQGDRLFAGYDSGVAGSVSASAWFRSNSTTGWYNSTYAVGWNATSGGYVNMYGAYGITSDTNYSSSVGAGLQWSAPSYGTQSLFTKHVGGSWAGWGMANGGIGTSEWCQFHANSGSIYNVAGVYGTISDVNEKEDIVPASSQWADIKAIGKKGVNYKLKNNKGYDSIKDVNPTFLGFNAQDVMPISPGLIDGLGTAESPYTVKSSVLFTKAVMALAEAMERIEALEAKVK